MRQVVGEAAAGTDALWGYEDAGGVSHASQTTHRCAGGTWPHL